LEIKITNKRKKEHQIILGKIYAFAKIQDENTKEVQRKKLSILQYA